MGLFSLLIGNLSISAGEIVTYLEWGRVFLEGALSKGIYVALSQWVLASQG